MNNTEGLNEKIACFNFSAISILINIKQIQFVQVFTKVYVHLYHN